MTGLDKLAAEAAMLAGGQSPEDEVSRQMQICNACRYCESFCAVFPAMTRRLDFDDRTIHYLANLCHNCGACLHACQYAPPHEFAVNVPRAMAAVRTETYVRFAWPASFAAAYRKSGRVTLIVTALCIALFVAIAGANGGLSQALVATGASSTNAAVTPGNFYAVFPHNFMAGVFGVAMLFVVISIAVSTRKFWKTSAEGDNREKTRGAATEATRNALTLRYLDGGHGDGCNDADDRFTLWRRRMHHFTFYGFMLCFASTSVATLYHYALRWPAPYPFTSLPVVLGTLGGLGLVIGPAGLLWLNIRRHPLHAEPRQQTMDRSFIALLLATSITGLALLFFRATAAMPLLLAVHLGIVLALFLLLPYGKFVHATYRCAALLKYAIERRQPSRIRLSSD